MPVPSPVVTALTKNKCFTFATLWEIERTDGTAFRFTNHDKEIQFDGDTFSPAGGFDASARQKQIDLEVENLEIVGIINSVIIAHDDLKAGLYREAKITERLIDWRRPWLGALETQVYYIAEVKFTGESWEAKIEGLTRWLEPRVGSIFGRACRHVLGDALCMVDVVGLQRAGVVSDITTAPFNDRRHFEATGALDAEADNFFDFGLLKWLTGNNAGLSQEVKLHLKDTGTEINIELQIETAFAIGVGDTFDVEPGCDKISTTCDTKFANLPEFGGFPFIPGNDRAMQTPRVK